MRGEACFWMGVRCGCDARAGGGSMIIFKVIAEGESGVLEAFTGGGCTCKDRVRTARGSLN